MIIYMFYLLRILLRLFVEYGIALNDFKYHFCNIKKKEMF